MRNHCGYCGANFSHLDWPRTCEACSNTSWLNPIPVVVVIQPVRSPEGDRVGLVMARRAIEPSKGQWALVGGFMDVNETAEVGGAREFFEETALSTETLPQIAYTIDNGRGQLMVVAEVKEAMSYERFLTGQVCPENFELGVLWEPDQNLAFPSHNRIVKKWFSENNK